MRRRELHECGSRYHHQSPDYRRARRQSLLYGPARTRISDELGFEECGLAAVRFHRCGLALEHYAADPYGRYEGLHRRQLAGADDPGNRDKYELHAIQCEWRDGLCGYVNAGLSGVQGAIHREFAKTASVDRRRRQLDIAVRTAAARSCQSHTHTKGRRNETLQLQRRNFNSDEQIAIFRPLRLHSALLRRRTHRRFPAPSLRWSTWKRSPANARPARPRQPLCAARSRACKRANRLSPRRCKPNRSRSRPRSMH